MKKNLLLLLLVCSVFPSSKEGTDISSTLSDILLWSGCMLGINYVFNAYNDYKYSQALADHEILEAEKKFYEEKTLLYKIKFNKEKIDSIVNFAVKYVPKNNRVFDDIVNFFTTKRISLSDDSNNPLYRGPHAVLLQGKDNFEKELWIASLAQKTNSLVYDVSNLEYYGENNFLTLIDTIVRHNEDNQPVILLSSSIDASFMQGHFYSSHSVNNTSAYETFLSTIKNHIENRSIIFVTMTSSSLEDLGSMHTSIFSLFDEVVEIESIPTHFIKKNFKKYLKKNFSMLTKDERVRLSEQIDSFNCELLHVLIKRIMSRFVAHRSYARDNSGNYKIIEECIQDVKRFVPENSKTKNSTYLNNKIHESYTYEDYIGNEEIVKKIKDIEHLIKKGITIPQAYQLIPKGILLQGKPGTGKTFLAKVLAKNLNIPFYYISPEDFKSKYYGKSNKNLKTLLDEAEKNAPAIIFIDECEEILQKKPAQTAVEKVDNEIANMLLQFMSGVKEKHVIIIGATNYPERIDPAFLRSGRFDYVLNFKNFSAEERKKYMRHLNKKYGLSFSEDTIMNIVKKSEGLSAADMDGVYKGASRIALLERDSLIPSAEDFLQSLSQVIDHNKVITNKKDMIKNEYTVNDLFDSMFSPYNGY